MWSTFTKYRKGSVSGEKSELLNNKVSKNQDPSGTSGGHKVRFDSVG